jgi:phage/plasmid-like protein (TIGR03299 family)
MAYVGETPWHGLGNQLPAGATLEQWQNASGLTWKANVAPMAYKPNGHWHPAEAYRAIYRSDTGQVFAVVSPKYQPVQPGQILKFFDDLTKSHGYQLDTAGALKGGAIVWGLASAGKPICIKGTDVLKPKLLISTGYDKSHATHVRPTTVRVVCNNTLRASMETDKDNITINHSTKFDEGQVKVELGLSEDTFARFEERANKLADHKPTRAQVATLLDELFGRKDPETGELTGNSRNVIAAVETCIVSSPGASLDSSRGTSWGVLNGITNYVDFQGRART